MERRTETRPLPLAATLRLDARIAGMIGSDRRHVTPAARPAAFIGGHRRIGLLAASPSSVRLALLGVVNSEMVKRLALAALNGPRE
jgi:hypothetical protein